MASTGVCRLSTELQVRSKLLRQILQRLQVAHSKGVWPPGKNRNQPQHPILKKKRHNDDGAYAELPAGGGIRPRVQRRITGQLHCSARSAYTCKARPRVDHDANFRSRIARNCPANQLPLLFERNRGASRMGRSKRLLDKFPKKLVWDTIEQLSKFCRQLYGRQAGALRRTGPRGWGVTLSGSCDFPVVISLNGECSGEQALKGLLVEYQVVSVRGHDSGGRSETDGIVAQVCPLLRELLRR